MRFFTQSNRTVKHLTSQLNDISEEVPWKMNIVVREWNEIKPEYEFRAFVYKRKLTAITHYYKFCYISDLQDNKEEYLSLMQNYYNRIQSLLPDNCVLDFCIFPDRKQVCIVELNPWSIHASSAKFSWEEDIKILTGEEEFEFRISEKPFPNIFSLISSTMGILWQTVRPLRYEEGEQLPRDVERTFYTFKWNNYKSLPFFKYSQGYPVISSEINWEFFEKTAIFVPTRDGLARCYWENSVQFYRALNMDVSSYVNSESVRPPQLITTFCLTLLIECAIIGSKGKKIPQQISTLFPLAQAAYLWLFDVFKVFNQPLGLKDKSSEINIYASNSLITLSIWNVLKKRNKSVHS